MNNFSIGSSIGSIGSDIGSDIGSIGSDIGSDIGSIGSDIKNKGGDSMGKIRKFFYNLILKKFKKCYVIHVMENGNYCLCKVLDIYDMENKALNALFRLLNHEMEEMDLIEEFNKREEF